jgi:hypothetical protein
MTGVIALMTYTDDFHIQAFKLPEDPPDWHSEELELGTLTDDTIIDKFDGAPIELPLNFWIMHSVRAALQTVMTQP